MRIFINQARFRACHGVDPQETIVGGDFTVSVSINYDFSNAALTDDLSDTISYAHVYAILQREMAVPSRLLEHVAGRIARSLKATYPQIESGVVTITKLNPPLGADCRGMGVELEF